MIKHTIKAKSTHNRTNPWQLDKEVWTQGVWLHNINMNGIGGPSINIYFTPNYMPLTLKLLGFFLA